MTWPESPLCPGRRECSVGSLRSSNQLCGDLAGSPCGPPVRPNRAGGDLGPTQFAECLGEESWLGLPFMTLGHSPLALALHRASSYRPGRPAVSCTLLFLKGMRFCTQLPLRSSCREIQTLLVPSRKSLASSIPRNPSIPFLPASFFLNTTNLRYKSNKVNFINTSNHKQCIMSIPTFPFLKGQV